MNERSEPVGASVDNTAAREASFPDSGLVALSGVAAFFRIAADPELMARDLALVPGRRAESADVVRAARRLGLKANQQPLLSKSGAFKPLPAPSILELKAGGFLVYGGRYPNGEHRVIEPVSRKEKSVPEALMASLFKPEALLVTRRFLSPGQDARTISLTFVLQALWRYRLPLAHVLFASLIVQIFALVTPLFFQVVVDKVLAHRSYATLTVLIVGLIGLGAFDIVLQYLRSYALNHTTNRIDVELGQKLFAHLLRLPIGYFETRSAGQTVARVRELETIRNFLTGQGLFAALDVLFLFVFVAVLFAYSVPLTLVVLVTLPIYLLIAAVLRPLLKIKVQEKFEKGALSQQFLVETVVGVQTVKASAIEPVMQAEWEERLASYVSTAFSATMLASLGQSAIQYVSKASTAILLLFGAWSVMDGTMTVGQLVAFNMIAAQVAQPILRLSQLFQDIQQVQVSLDRLGDVLNAPQERTTPNRARPPAVVGQITLNHVRFRYRPGLPDVLKDVSLSIKPGEVIGIVGASGSGKSTLTKLIQRFYIPDEGQVLLDGMDLSQVDPAWLRRNIGVVLQDNLLFNRTIAENISLANPALSRADIVRVARLAGADTFIAEMPEGYDTVVEERGVNLSGGQRQRIAIARALASNPPILILDEATSALDYESERVIQENMRDIVRGRTVIIIAHRLAAVRTCHRIVGMEGGRIIEVGTHDELLARPQGIYARLWSLQNARDVS